MRLAGIRKTAQPIRIAARSINNICKCLPERRFEDDVSREILLYLDDTCIDMSDGYRNRFEYKSISRHGLKEITGGSCSEYVYIELGRVAPAAHSRVHPISSLLSRIVTSSEHRFIRRCSSSVHVGAIIGYAYLYLPGWLFR